MAADSHPRSSFPAWRCLPRHPGAAPAARRATPQSVQSHAADRASHRPGVLLSRDELRFRRMRSLRVPPEDRRRGLCLPQMLRSEPRGHLGACDQQRSAGKCQADHPTRSGAGQATACSNIVDLPSCGHTNAALGLSVELPPGLAVRLSPIDATRRRRSSGMIVEDAIARVRAQCG
jgi:hypothetical protein